ncbi:MAG: hypothetical protein DI587_37110 [Variovorax paradoxus]|nr:MAG: hypothetical protein DI583_37110 [Variovorax paradoxus]PZQ00387.1 MAG: hypothetical protein DI587_37110 [Variovorax paradoxus]
MTEDQFLLRFSELSAAQDRAAALVLPALDKNLISSLKLCGGTALSRFYLNHRLSYDLDFFVPSGVGFDAQDLANRISKLIKISSLELTHDTVKADQLHFMIMADERTPIKISFVEDMYSHVYPLEPRGLSIGSTVIATEPVEGLYYRKLRTVVGWADSHSEFPQGGRQTARDMFDLYVLSHSVMPLRQFIEGVPDAFPISAFENGLANMPWFDIAPELSETVAAPAWNSGKDVEVLQKRLYEDLGMKVLTGESSPEADDQVEPAEEPRRGFFRRRGP